ncbi:hypothetical protein EVG20_g2983 [Dentipellis fragilis]|uniref:BTB domain-containing protein n=1 Tax=Dentipellis fragilis TaxID=205917 RepID=A0A4Y9Z8U2_9AGAM|nr:hypothetical protein EVG20_g2983 [Dentipellis fragilis]
MQSAQWDSIVRYITEELSVSPPERPPERPKLTASVSQPLPITPPDSNAHTPQDEQRDVVSVSVIFYPGSTPDSLPSDLALLTSDDVFFYVHSDKLLAASDNGFNMMLPRGSMQGLTGDPPLLFVPEDSMVLNIILHTIYNMSAAQFSPTTQAIIDAVDAMTTYGIPAKTYIAPSTPLYLHLLANAAINPIEVYALAASLDIVELAVGASAHLLSYPLSSLTDELATKMGAIYLKRLVFFHLGRCEALKRLLLPPPPFHPHTTCGSAEQTTLRRAWALASAYLTWETRPDLSTSAIETALYPLGDHLACKECRRLLKERIGDLVVQWAQVKRKTTCRSWLIRVRVGRGKVNFRGCCTSSAELAITRWACSVLPGGNRRHIVVELISTSFPAASDR